MSWLGGLLSAGASILGGIFGGKKDKPQVTTSYVDYRRMVREAEAAGFNPLTAIRNGGSAGFTVSSSSGGASSTPLSRIAGSLPGMVDNFLTQIDPFNDKSREMQYRIQEAQLANLQADTAARNRLSIGGVPSVTGGNVARRPIGSGVPHGKTNIPLASVLPASAGETKTPKVEQPTVTNPYPTRSGMVVNPGVPDAEASETRYGDSEIASMISGALTAGADIYANIDKGARAWVDRYKRTPGIWDDVSSAVKNHDKKKRPMLDRPWWENPTNIPPPLLDPRRFR